MATEQAQAKHDSEQTRERNPGEQAPLEIVASSGISIRLWRLYAQAWLVCLLFPIVYLMQTPLTPARLFIAVAGLLLFVILYTWFMWPHPLNVGARPQPDSLLSLIALTSLMGLVGLLIFLYGSAFLWLWVGVSAVVGVALTARNAFIAVMGLTLLTVGLGIALSGGVATTDWLQIVPLVLLVRGLGLDMVGLVRLADALRELHAARGELARRAVTEERLRLARDLHDLLGHTLSLITLKSELARRLIEQEPAQAAQEIHEVERVARQALREVREAVAGYRQPTLRREIEGAREILAAAGITCTVEYPIEKVAPAVEAVLAWTVREAVTNVIRHSRARHCTLQVKSAPGRIWAEIRNDGYRAADQNPVRSPTGSGLAGLIERVTAQGGQIEAGPQLFEGQPGFHLWVEFPVQQSPRVERKLSR